MPPVGRHCRPVPPLVEDLPECRTRVPLGEMADDAERYFVQLEQDEAPYPGHSLTSASNARHNCSPDRSQLSRVWLRQRRRSEQGGRHYKGFGGAPLHFGDTSAMAGACAELPAS